MGDWPEGTSGFTVQLESFPNDGSVPVSEVDAAESEAAGKGAGDVGALNSDDYGSLEPGEWIVYSGVFEGKKGKAEAQKALKRLRKDYPDAKVIKVNSAAGDTGAASSGTADDALLKDLQSSTGEEQQKKSAQLPEELSLGGKPPPKDNKAPEGRSEPGGVEIE